MSGWEVIFPYQIFFFLVLLNPRRSSATLLVMLEDRKIAYGLLMSKQEMVCANPFSILECGFLHCLGVSVGWKETKEE